SLGGDRTIRLWDPARGKQIRRFQKLPGVGPQFALSPNGKTLAVIAGEGNKLTQVRLWEVATGKELRALVHPDPVRCLAFSPDSQVLASATGDSNKPGDIRLWQPATGKLIRSWKGHPGWIFAVAFAPDGKAVVSSGLDNTIRIW